MEFLPAWRKHKLETMRRIVGDQLIVSRRFIVISQQLSGAAMVRRWSAYIHPRLASICGLSRRLGGLARRSGSFGTSW